MSYDDDNILGVLADLLDPAGTVSALERERIEKDWLTWVTTVLPHRFSAGFAPHHKEIWDWAWGIRLGLPYQDLIAVLPRGGGKSYTVAAVLTALAARNARRYVLYVSSTQDQADKHLKNTAEIMTDGTLTEYYPEIGRRTFGAVGGKSGDAWRRNRITVGTGFTIDALGLDSAARGLRYGDQRPDMIVIDDIDEHNDSEIITKGRIEQLTRKLFPAGSPDMIVFAVQNLVHPDSVFAQLMDGRAGFLLQSKKIGPIPAIVDFEVVKMSWEEAEQEFGIEDIKTQPWKIVSGRATWPEWQSLDWAQKEILRNGLDAFMQECQHEVRPPDGGMFDHVDFLVCDPENVPDFVRTTVWVDPAITNNDRSDRNGIQCDGITDKGVIYRLFSWEERSSPAETMKKAIDVAITYGAHTIGIETDQGGLTWGSVFREAVREWTAEHGELPWDIRMLSAKAGQSVGGKQHRAHFMLKAYESRQIVHVDNESRPILEKALRRFPRTKPHDLVDVCYWSWLDLTGGSTARIIEMADLDPDWSPVEVSPF